MFQFAGALQDTRTSTRVWLPRGIGHCVSSGEGRRARAAAHRVSAAFELTPVSAGSSSRRRADSAAR